MLPAQNADMLLHIISNAMKASVDILYSIFGICLDGACANLDGLFFKIHYNWILLSISLTDTGILTISSPTMVQHTLWPLNPVVMMNILVYSHVGRKLHRV